MMHILSNGWMEEEALQKRRAINLKAWIDTHFDGSVARAARHSGKSDSQLRDMLAGRKAFGEKVARPLEAKFGMESGALDRPTKPAAQVKRDWPFNFPRSQIEDLDPDQRRRVEDTITGMILVFSGLDRKKKRTGTDQGNP
jgi:hypothetical protein